MYSAMCGSFAGVKLVPFIIAGCRPAMQKLSSSCEIVHSPDGHLKLKYSAICSLNGE